MTSLMKDSDTAFKQDDPSNYKAGVVLRDRLCVFDVKLNVLFSASCVRMSVTQPSSGGHNIKLKRLPRERTPLIVYGH